MILDRFNVTDKVAIVTGAGRGIGAASAVALAEAGADVLVAARTDEQLRQVAAKVEAVGRRAVVVAGDLNDLDVVAALAPAAYDAFGHIDIVVNNLGGTMPRPLLDTSPRFWRRPSTSTWRPPTRSSGRRSPHMLEGGGGAIVNISSVMGRVAGRGYLAYGTVKAALAHYTRLAAADLCPASE